MFCWVIFGEIRICNSFLSFSSSPEDIAREKRGGKGGGENCQEFWRGGGRRKSPFFPLVGIFLPTRPLPYSQKKSFPPYVSLASVKNNIQTHLSSEVMDFKVFKADILFRLSPLLGRNEVEKAARVGNWTQDDRTRGGGGGHGNSLSIGETMGRRKSEGLENGLRGGERW